MTRNAPVSPRLPIDTSRQYRTRDGRVVTLHDYVLRNSLGEVVTFPIKGSIRAADGRGPSKYAIWMNDGAASALGPSNDDIIDLPPVVTTQLGGCLDCR